MHRMKIVIPRVRAVLFSAVIIGAVVQGHLYAVGPPEPPPEDSFYVELTVRPDADGEYEFTAGDEISLSWRVQFQAFGFTDIPVAIYLAAALEPPKEDQPVEMGEILSSRELYLFNNQTEASLYDPSRVSPTWSPVVFPLGPYGNGGGVVTENAGGMVFRVPPGHRGRWAFAAAFLKLNGGGFVILPAVEVSKGFTIN